MGMDHDGAEPFRTTLKYLAHGCEELTTLVYGIIHQWVLIPESYAGSPRPPQTNA